MPKSGHTESEFGINFEAGFWVVFSKMPPPSIFLSAKKSLRQKKLKSIFGDMSFSS